MLHEIQSHFVAKATADLKFQLVYIGVAHIFVTWLFYIPTETKDAQTDKITVSPSRAAPWKRPASVPQTGGIVSGHYWGAFILEKSGEKWIVPLKFGKRRQKEKQKMENDICCFRACFIIHKFSFQPRI